MAQFHDLRITDLTRETEDCVSIAFDIPESLKTEYQYKPGQYVTIKAHLEGEDIRRSYSLCSAPAVDSEYRVAIKLVENGKMSTYLNHITQAGHTLHVMPPAGNFCRSHPVSGAPSIKPSTGSTWATPKAFGAPHGYRVTANSPKRIFVSPLQANARALLPRNILEAPYRHGGPTMMLTAVHIRFLPTFFAAIPDPRRVQGRRHSLATVLALAEIGLQKYTHEKQSQVVLIMPMFGIIRNLWFHVLSSGPLQCSSPKVRRLPSGPLSGRSH